MSDGEFPAIDGNTLGVMVAVNIDKATISYLIGSVKWLANEDLYEGDVEDVYETSQAFEQLAIRLAAATPSGDPELTVIPVGSTFSYAGNTAPEGYLLCDGTTYLKADYPALSTILTAYSLNETEFKVPNLSGRMPLGVSGTHALASEGGAETHTLAVNEIASHAHTINHGHTTQPHGHTQDAHQHEIVIRNNVAAFGNALLAAGANASTNDSEFTDFQQPAIANATVTVDDHAGTSGNTGGGEAHNNMPPFHTLNFIIKT